MTRFYDLTPEELRLVVAFINDESKDALRNDIPQKLNSLYARFQSKLAKELEDREKRIFSLQRQLDRYQSKQEKDTIEGVFTDTGLDSFEVAQALLYRLQQLKTYRLTKGKVIDILYEMYASWLGSKRERLFLEHPVATEYGPNLWRVSKRLEVGTPVSFSAYESLAQKNPGVAAFTRNAAAKYYDYSENTLKEHLLKSLPYKNALPIHNSGKWNKEISDSDIYNWKNKR